MRALITRMLLSRPAGDVAEWLLDRWPLRDVLRAYHLRKEAALRAVFGEPPA